MLITGLSHFAAAALFYSSCFMNRLLAVIDLLDCFFVVID